MIKRAPIKLNIEVNSGMCLKNI